jgi:hypothetical protein
MEFPEFQEYFLDQLLGGLPLAAPNRHGPAMTKELNSTFAA